MDVSNSFWVTAFQIVVAQALESEFYYYYALVFYAYFAYVSPYKDLPVFRLYENVVLLGKFCIFFRFQQTLNLNFPLTIVGHCIDNTLQFKKNFNFCLVSWKIAINSTFLTQYNKYPKNCKTFNAVFPEKNIPEILVFTRSN